MCITSQGSKITGDTKIISPLTPKNYHPPVRPSHKATLPYAEFDDLQDTILKKNGFLWIFLQ